MSDWHDAESHADRALEMYERGRWAEAESELRKALSLNPEQGEWHYNLGLTLEAAGRDAEALASYERVAELIPDQVDARLAAGAACLRLRGYRDALKWLDRAIALEPAMGAAYAYKIDALVRLGDHDEAEATFYLAQHALPEPSASCFAAVAESLIDRASYDRAAWCLKEALRLEPTMPRVRARLGAVFAARGKPQRALQMYLRDLRDDPGNIDTLLDYGELLIDLGRLPEAAEKFRRVLEIEPANVDAHERLGHVALITGHCEQAHLEYELVLKLDSRFPLIRLSLAEALLQRGRRDAARLHLLTEVEEWARAHTEEEDPPRHPPVQIVRFGDLLLEAGCPAEAKGLFERALDEEGERAALLRKVAVARFRSGDIDGGAAASRRALRLDPHCVASVHNLALAAIDSGQLRAASGWVMRGLRMNRHDDGLRRLRMQLAIAWLRRLFRRDARERRAASATAPRS